MPSSSGNSTHSATGLSSAIRRGEVTRRDWIRDSVVISTEEFAQRRSLTPQALGDMAAAGQAFHVVIDGVAWWPAALLDLKPNDAADVCLALAGCDSVLKLVFLMRLHGGLGGRKVAQALAQGERTLVLQLAREWRRSQAHS